MKLTKEQELKAKELLKTIKWRSLKRITKLMALLFGMVALTLFLDVKYVQSKMFVFFASFLNGFTIYYIENKYWKHENNWIKNEVDKILK
jgi:hypothetical protein